MSTTAPHLSPRLIAKPLDDLRSWQLADGADLAGTHRAVLRALLATDALANLELPLDMRAPRLEDTREIMQWEVIAKLLTRHTRDTPLSRLTERERDVLALMAEGCSNTAIAQRLFISEGAVAKHTTSIFAKLDLAPSDDVNRRVLAVLAYLHG